MSVVLNGAVKVVDLGGQIVTGIANVPHHAGIIFAYATTTITGIVGTALSCLAGGSVNRFNEAADKTRSVAFILPIIYLSVVGCLNEKAYDEQVGFPDLGYCRKKFDFFAKAFDYRAKVNHPVSDAPAPSFWAKHGPTRGYYFIATLIAAISRVADLVLGLVGLIVSLACAGQWDDANKFTAKNLTILGIIDDLSRGIRGMVNPGQACLELTPLK